LHVRLKILFGKIVRFIHRPAFPFTKEGVLINLGCGNTNHPKFINVDGYPYPHVHFVHRIDKLPMFKDNFADLIYASHCLEHFKYKYIGKVLDEWFRILKPGAVLRLSVPDFDKLLDIFNETNNPDDIQEQLLGGQDNKYNFHYAVFNRKNLTAHLCRAGFVEIKEWLPGVDEFSTFHDFSIYKKEILNKKFEISLNIEARKL